MMEQEGVGFFIILILVAFLSLLIIWAGNGFDLPHSKLEKDCFTNEYEGIPDQEGYCFVIPRNVTEFTSLSSGYVFNNKTGVYHATINDNCTTSANCSYDGKDAECKCVMGCYDESLGMCIIWPDVPLCSGNMGYDAETKKCVFHSETPQKCVLTECDLYPTQTIWGKIFG